MSDRFTQADERALKRKRAIGPTLTAAAAGTSAAALGANVAGIGLRRVGQKKVFNEGFNDYEWVKRPGATAKQMKLSRIGSKIQAKALPLSIAAGGIGAVSAANAVQTSRLWNKKDKIVTKSVFDKDSSVSSFEEAIIRNPVNTKLVRGVLGKARNESERNAILGGLDLGIGLMLPFVATSVFNRVKDDELAHGIKR